MLGSRIKAQGEEEVDWRRETRAAQAKDASQAGGVGPLCVCTRCSLNGVGLSQM